MDDELKMSTREEAQQAVRALVGAWGAELVVKGVVETVTQTVVPFMRSDLETMRVWNSLHDLIPRGR